MQYTTRGGDRLKPRKDIIELLEEGNIRADEYYFKNLCAPPLLSFIPFQDILYLNRLATSIQLSAKIEYKYQEIDRVMERNNFVRMGRGTNRAVYRHLENKYICVKVAIDDVGIRDNPREFINQDYLYPFVCKIFEVDPTGTVALVERVNPITNRDEFASIGHKIFDLIRFWFTGKYVMEDIGVDYFMNWGTRYIDGCPVLLDFPYMYELDYSKIHCCKPDIGGVCGGEIDYDDGYNRLVCTKCGARYKATELSMHRSNLKVDKEACKMNLKVKFTRSNGEVLDIDASSKVSSRSVIEDRYAAAQAATSNYSKKLAPRLDYTPSLGARLVFDEQPEQKEEPVVEQPKEETQDADVTVDPSDDIYKHVDTSEVSIPVEDESDNVVGQEESIDINDVVSELESYDDDEICVLIRMLNDDTIMKIYKGIKESCVDHVSNDNQIEDNGDDTDNDSGEEVDPPTDDESDGAADQEEDTEEVVVEQESEKEVIDKHSFDDLVEEKEDAPNEHNITLQGDFIPSNNATIKATLVHEDAKEEQEDTSSAPKYPVSFVYGDKCLFANEKINLDNIRSINWFGYYVVFTEDENNMIILNRDMNEDEEKRIYGTVMMDHSLDFPNGDFDTINIGDTLIITDIYAGYDDLKFIDGDELYEDLIHDKYTGNEDDYISKDASK